MAGEVARFLEALDGPLSQDLVRGRPFELHLDHSFLMSPGPGRVPGSEGSRIRVSDADAVRHERALGDDLDDGG